MTTDYDNEDNMADDAERSLSDVIAELRRKREAAEPAEPSRAVAAHAEPPPPSAARPAPSAFAYHLRHALVDLEVFLLEKNRRYGNSAIEPMRVFSRADPITQLDVRIDDKLSRLKHRQDDDTEDTERDTLGYLILKEVYRRMCP